MPQHGTTTAPDRRPAPRRARRTATALAACAIGILGAASTVAPAGATGTTGATGATGTTGEKPPTFAPTGPYTTLRTGTTKVDGKKVTWKVLRAPGPTGMTCWRFDAKPAPKRTGVNAPKGARCTYDPVPPVDPTDVPQFVAANASGSKYGFVVVNVPKGTNGVRYATIGSTRFTKTSGTSPIVIVTKKSPLWVDLTLQDGGKLECPAGVLIDRSDLLDPVLAKPSVGAAWFCDVPGT